MVDRRLLPAGEFAKRARVTMATLHHYDSMGLLSPVLRGKNSYRYYSLTQLSELNLIRTMQELGLPLSEIKALKDLRTPARTAETLKLQVEKIEEKIDEWVSARKLILALLKSILSAYGTDEDAITIQYLPAESIMLGDWNAYGKGEDGYDALVKFYDSISKTHPGININYPVWGLFTEENLKTKMKGRHTWPERYYFYTPDGQDKRPAGFYAVGYARGGYGQNDKLYVRLRNYINKNGFEVCGDAYEEYPLNEICVSDNTNYLMRVMITVREKKIQGLSKNKLDISF